MARLPPEAREKVRRRLLETAARQFADRGLEGASMDGIALGAGYAKGTVYNYFPSKEELFAEVLAEGCRRVVERYGRTPPGSSTRERLEALAAADVAVLREEEGFLKVVVREAMRFDPRTYPLIVSHLAPYRAQVEAILDRGREAGEVRGDRPVPELALAFIGSSVLLLVQHWGSAGAWPALEDIPELAVAWFLDGAGARAAGASP